MKITSEMKQSVQDQLARNPLPEVRFDCVFGVEDGTLVSITVEGQKHFFYTLHPSKVAGRPWEVRESPGPVFHGAETSRFLTLEEAIHYIDDWRGRVVDQVKQSKRKSTRE